MRPMKARGLADVKATLKRVRQLRALGRVDAPDAEFIIDHLQEVEARIISMREEDERGEAVP